MGVDVNKVQSYYKFAFHDVAPAIQLELMCQALMSLLHVALNADGGILRYSNLSHGHRFECKDGTEAGTYVIHIF